MIERSVYIGGCDGVASVASAALIRIEPMGTMPHALVLLHGDTVDTARACDEIISPEVPRVELIDTMLDERDILDPKDLVDGFGVGTSISNSPVIDFSMDIVEIDGKPIRLHQCVVREARLLIRHESPSEIRERVSNQIRSVPLV
jgi:nicotinic acid phosphoribosyltransferase